MRKQKAEQVGTLIHQFLREEGLETPYNEYRLIEAWPESVKMSNKELVDWANGLYPA